MFKMGFVRNLWFLCRLFYLAGKYQIFIGLDGIKLPRWMRFYYACLMLFFYPLALIRSPVTTIGNRLGECLRFLGPIYIKFGQTLSTRPDLVGADIAEHLQYLQDKLPPFSFEEVCKKIESATGQALHEVFEFVHTEAFAAASISQVHKAKLLSGEYVAVKVLRPKIHERYSNDIQFLRFLARIIQFCMPKIRRLRLLEVIAVFSRTMYFELDLKSEAAFAASLSHTFQDDPLVLIPRVYWSYTSSEVLILEWLDGISVYDVEKLTMLGLDNNQLAQQVATLFFNMAYRDGFFHADLHPGNIFVSPEGKIILIDFGIMGVLPEKDRFGVAEILHCILTRSYYKVAELHKKLGYIPQDVDLDDFAQSIRIVSEEVMQGEIKSLSVGGLLGKLFKLTEKYGMRTQPQLIMLQKTMVVVEGIGKILSPKVNIWQLAEPCIRKWAAQNLSLKAKISRSLKKFVTGLVG